MRGPSTSYTHTAPPTSSNFHVRQHQKTSSRRSSVLQPPKPSTNSAGITHSVWNPFQDSPFLHRSSSTYDRRSTAFSRNALLCEVSRWTIAGETHRYEKKWKKFFEAMRSLDIAIMYGSTSWDGTHKNSFVYPTSIMSLCDRNQKSASLPSSTTRSFRFPPSP